MRILIADTDPVTRSLLSSALGDRYDVSEARNGGQAVRFITEAHEYGEPFDVVLLDMELSDNADRDIVKFLKALEEPRSLVGAKSSRVILVAGGKGTPQWQPNRVQIEGRDGVDVAAILREVERVASLA